MPEKFGFGEPDAETRKLLGLDKEPIPQEKIEQLFPSPDSRRAIEQMSAETMPRKSAIEYKKNNVVEIREKNLINPEILKQHPTIYVGSSVDIEYPLLLGARNITLVDPIFRDEKAVAELAGRIVNFTGENPQQVSAQEISFSFDFGEGDEDVLVQISPTAYAKQDRQTLNLPAELSSTHDEQEITQSYDEPEKFTPPDEIGMLLGFRTTETDLDQDEQAFANVVEGGYVLTDNAFNSFFNTVRERSGGEIATAIEMDTVKEVWDENGFEFIPLEHLGDSYQYTFLRKMETADEGFSQ